MTLNAVSWHTCPWNYLTPQNPVEGQIHLKHGPGLQLMLMSYWWQMHIITSLTGLSTGALHNLLLVAHIITYCACSQTFEQKKDCSQSIEKCVFSVSKVQESKLITSNNTMHWLTSYSKIQVKIKFMLLYGSSKWISINTAENGFQKGNLPSLRVICPKKVKTLLHRGANFSELMFLWWAARICPQPYKHL